MTPPGFSWADQEASTIAAMIATFGEPVEYQQASFPPLTIRMWPQDAKLLPDAPARVALRLTAVASNFPQPPAEGDIAIRCGVPYTVYEIDARIRGHFVLWLRK